MPRPLSIQKPFTAERLTEHVQLALFPPGR